MTVTNFAELELLSWFQNVGLGHFSRIHALCVTTADLHFGLFAYKDQLLLFTEV
jgi:hypothetical protein